MTRYERRLQRLVTSLWVLAASLPPQVAMAQDGQPPAEISNFVKGIVGAVLAIAVGLSGLSGVKIWWAFRNNDPDAWRVLTNNIIGISIMLSFSIIVAWISGFFGGGYRL